MDLLGEEGEVCIGLGLEDEEGGEDEEGDWEWGRNRSSRVSTRDKMVAIRSASSTPISERSKTSSISFVATALTSDPVAEAEAE